MLIQYSRLKQATFLPSLLFTIFMNASSSDTPTLTKLKTSSIILCKQLQDKRVLSCLFDKKNSNILHIITVRPTWPLHKTDNQIDEIKQYSYDTAKKTMVFCQHLALQADKINNYNIAAQNKQLITPYHINFHQGDLYMHLSNNKLSYQTYKPIRIKQKKCISALALHPNKSMIACYQGTRHPQRNNSRLTIWHINKKNKAKQISSFTIIKEKTKKPVTDIKRLAFAPNETLIAALNFDDAYVCNYQTKNKKLKEKTLPMPTKYHGYRMDLLFTDQKELIIAREQMISSYKSSAPYNRLKQFTAHNQLFFIVAIALSSDKALLAAVNDQLQVTCWNFNTTQQLYYNSRSNVITTSPYPSISFNADNSKIAISKTHNPIYVYNIPKQKITSLKKLVAFVIGRNKIDTSRISKLLLNDTCLE